jgi:hypothetical protein
VTETPPIPDMLKMRRESELEASLYVQIKQAGLPLPHWHKIVKGHETDFCWDKLGIIVEVMGGTGGYGKGRGAHVREPGYSNDCMYSNRRQCEGWLVFWFTKKHIESGKALKFLQGVLT